MDIKYLAIEGDTAVHERESAFWKSCGITSIRVPSMSDAIKEAAKNQFLYIGINADNIDYKPKLKLLRGITNDPIFISTSSYTMQEQGEANSLGADLFGQAGDSPEDNYNAVMSKIHRLNERAKHRKAHIKLIFYENILVAPSYRQVFFEDTPVQLTKTEFTILCFILNSRGRVITFRQIYRDAWGDEYDHTIHEVIRNHIKKIRRKFTDISPEYKFIESVHGLGYKLRQPKDGF